MKPGGLRSNLPFSIQGERAQRRYSAEVMAAWRGMRTRYQVAPRCRVRLADGRFAEAGEAIRPADVAGLKGTDGYLLGG